MFATLPESNSNRHRRPLGVAASTAVHLVLIAVAVRATAWTAPAPRSVAVDPRPIYIAPPRPVQPIAPAARRGGSASEPSANTPVPVPPPLAPISSEIRNTLPPIDQPLTPVGRDDFVRRPPVAGNPSDRPGSIADGDALPERFVEKAVMPIPGTTAPRYPAALQSAGVEGTVHARFVVDTLGMVERGSVRILDTTHDLFAQAVRDALSRARFVPAEAGGRKVRQLVEQAFTFRLEQ